MKQKISYSFLNSGVTVTTIILWVIFIALLVLYLVFNGKNFDDVLFWCCLGYLVLVAGWTLIVIPVSVSADDDYVSINKPFYSKKIKMNEIKSIEPIELKKLTFLPKWTGFSPKAKGEYYAFYRSPNNPIIIKMKDGREFIVGSSDSQELCEYINDKIK